MGEEKNKVCDKCWRSHGRRERRGRTSFSQNCPGSKPITGQRRGVFTSWLASVASLTTHRIILERNFILALHCILTVSFTWGHLSVGQKAKNYHVDQLWQKLQKENLQTMAFLLILCLPRYSYYLFDTWFTIKHLSIKWIYLEILNGWFNSNKGIKMGNYVTLIIPFKIYMFSISALS